VRAVRRQIEGQKAYYAERQPSRMEAADTPYVRRHFNEAANAVDLQNGERVCEWGAGMGRFSVLFAERGCAVTAVELSPELAAVCAQNTRASARMRIEVGDILEVAKRLEPSYSLVAGFFVLHHLPEVEPYFQAARDLLRPGGRFVFVEPNPLNPLYIVQITCTPGMRWRHEAGTYRMWPAALKRQAEAAGFSDFETRRYGALPRTAYNSAARMGVERWPEYLTPSPMRPFQIFSARRA
jgi:SAM-dependent methyltransferase